ncbi:MAG: 4-(cytidine 5'-diphospho)-2-C-methyl-D-erythritol kinase [Myxococcales bacterium]|nr:4-(cytidine 5'-diphospho)-2-C-methyl-D-erythritol kinase [Myxococcales bacterium]MDH5305869.1 4-(cytidine 5'-diphospho)-2-C-methyl-D-erythritol kinase [Myxococcales bacterium]
MMPLSAPAKINLGLRILRRRSDGYHELESLFLPLDLADVLELEVRDASRPSVHLRLAGRSAQVPDGGENLAARAAQAYLDRAGLACRVEIALAKHTPAAAGLGGGSSDAGAVLRALAARFPDALGPEALHALALALGADVPFFLDPRPCWVSGVGERLEPVEGLPALPLLLVNPGVALATAEVYRAFDALHPGWSRAPAPAPDGRALADPRTRAERLAGWVDNDLASAALRLCPAIGRVRQRLQELGALAVGMSGSGATLYGVFPDAASARASLDRAGFAPPAWGRVATTLESR